MASTLVLSSNTCIPMRSTTVIKTTGLALALLLLCSCSRVQPSRPGTFHRPIAQETVDTAPSTPSEEHEVPDDVPFADVKSVASVDHICICEEGTDQAVADAVNDTLLSLPRWLREAFIKSGWEMHVVPYDIAEADYGELYDSGSVVASTAYKARVIKIQNVLTAAANAPIHEMGHWLDAQLNYPSVYDEAFNAIYEAEASVYKDTFGPTCSWDIQEFMAEGFWCYWQSPRALQKACPEYYSFVESGLKLVCQAFSVEY